MATNKQVKGQSKECQGSAHTGLLTVQAPSPGNKATHIYSRLSLSAIPTKDNSLTGIP